MRQGFLAFVSLFALVGAARAQTYSTVENEALGIRFKMHEKLQSIPLKLGEAHPNMKMRFEPRSVGDHIHGRLGTYEWYLNVLAFQKEAPTATGKPAADKAPPAGGEGGGEGEGEGEGAGGKPGRAELLEAANRERAAKDWNSWVTEKDPGIKDRTFKTKGKEMRAKGKTPASTWWEYSDKLGSHSGQDIFWYSCASVYELPTMQIAIVVTVPVMEKSGEKPEDKHYKWQTTMAQSLEVLPTPAGGGDDDVSSVEAKKDLYANTEERKKALEAAKANIASLAGWDYFTMPNYIVLYSWNPDKPDRRPGSVKFAKQIVEALEKMRDLYIRDYPPHDKMVQPYSVLRVCDDHEAFMKYGSTQWGVVGWFSPLSKELVVFDDRFRIYGGKQDVFATTMHEGWHQYANSYFGEDVELHRWFDEGTGDYYGGFTKQGSSSTSWRYTSDKGRLRSIEAQIARKTFIPTREIVSWNKDKFYGPRAPDHYAQGYSLVDFLRRGADKLGKKFDPRWGTILETYRVTMLETKNQKTAVEKAFEGVDFAVFEEAWLEWVKKHMK